MGDKVDIFKVNGYNIGQLMKDMKFKISTYLHEAGLHSTPYAN